jgi:hypothetical protein
LCPVAGPTPWPRSRFRSAQPLPRGCGRCACPVTVQAAAAAHRVDRLGADLQAGRHLGRCQRRGPRSTLMAASIALRCRLWPFSAGRCRHAAASPHYGGRACDQGRRFRDSGREQVEVQRAFIRSGLSGRFPRAARSVPAGPSLHSQKVGRREPRVAAVMGG